ncbi:MAG: cache domain-containing protein [bacterium]|nr:MAG: cache domain-containing protein [bacterium]
MKLPLRTRLLVSFIIVIAITGAVSTLVGMMMISEGIIRQVQDKVRLDLNTARVEYAGEVNDVHDAVRYTVIRTFLRSALAAGNVASLADDLEAIRLGESLDILTLTDANGTVLLRTRNPSIMGDSQADNPILKKAQLERRTIAATAIFMEEQLRMESPDLAERAYMRLIPTPKGKPTDRIEETSGMMIMAAGPVFGDQGELLGMLYGGKLLNRDNRLVDKIKQTVYQGEIYHGRDIGTATIFQGDLRISTNVRTTNGDRAIGTRVSAEVSNRVLTEGRRWVERAFVVNDWYVTAYEPIRNVSGSIIGILYVGMLERKFTDMKKRIIWTFLGISVGGIFLAVLICFVLSRTLTKPADALVHAARHLANGDLKQRVQPERTIKEIEALGEAFNMMASAIEERDEQLRRRAQNEIMESKKLAVIGQLASGVAHEINNPLGGILLFSNLLLRKASAEGVERDNLERIVKEAERCQKIVQGLLEFAGQREPKTEHLDMNVAVGKAVSLLENQSLFHNIEIVKRLQQELPPVSADESQIQQVFVNIIMNAAEAMEGHGVLTVSTNTSAAGDGVEARFNDTGPGISEEDLQQLFEPFFTTKEVGYGTGLGLSISHGIIERHGGTLRAESHLGEGSTFIVTLPTAASGPGQPAGEGA